MSYSPTFLVFPEGRTGRTAFDQPQHHRYAPASSLCLHDKHGGFEVRDAFVGSDEVHAKGRPNGVSCRFGEKPQPRSLPRQTADGAERQDRRGILHRLFDCRREKDQQPRRPPPSGGDARQRGPDREGDSACLCLCDPPAPKRPFSLVDAAIAPPASSAEPPWPSVPGWAAVPNSPTVPFWTGMPGSPIVPGWARTRPVPEGAEVERRNREVREVLTKRDARCNGRPNEQNANGRRPCLVRRSSDLAARVEAASPGGSLSCTHTPTRGLKKFRSRLNVGRGAGATDARDRKSILRSMPNLDTILGHEDRLERRSARGAAMFISLDNDSLNNNNSNNNKNKNNNNNHLNNNVDCSWQGKAPARRGRCLGKRESRLRGAAACFRGQVGLCCLRPRHAQGSPECMNSLRQMSRTESSVSRGHTS